MKILHGNGNVLENFDVSTSKTFESSYKIYFIEKLNMKIINYII